MQHVPYKAFRISIVLATVAAWLSISNHCVIGGLIETKSQSAMPKMHCHGNQPSPSKKSNQEELPCCKVLKAIEAKTATVPPATFDFILKEYLVGVSLPIISEQHGLLIACDSGPPALAFSFSETVLQRSLLAHAPPVSLS